MDKPFAESHLPNTKNETELLYNLERKILAPSMIAIQDFIAISNSYQDGDVVYCHRHLGRCKYPRNTILQSQLPQDSKMASLRTSGQAVDQIGSF